MHTENLEKDLFVEKKWKCKDVEKVKLVMWNGYVESSWFELMQTENLETYLFIEKVKVQKLREIESGSIVVC